mmetsp:Transcript_30292/g.45653  ORF Transcript_30292/g.45653 Transcript_30292/m.45653 type:complete len:121 (-) Transcript_30292:355-717(-)|eukprot:CAMPEP_0194765778 /NCGR_PEP_ID=MMETSP0323_2-20130528/27201_1 /TAXON_ID=2866 ORGANISM="Crypthecodinium cohnii, Strain Seligo" /NCGR_SAMPLE_ID=MMETSP0323_2 /ASSEMBLY_ACC=CAM_ASM_000346 /LENGTH=120 /DNA_ID=CAMNT_0039695891 /DNA_START=52 /DNA_END=414 /DNA_ORIENTATION=+
MVKGHAFRKGWKEARKSENKRASSRIKSMKRDTLAEREQKKREMAEVKAKEAEMMAARKERRATKAKKQEAKKRRKEENDMKSGKYQVINKTDKIRKWHKSARKKLMTMSAEQIQTLIKR